MPVIPVKKGEEDKKRIIGKGAEDKERHKVSLTQKIEVRFIYAGRMIKMTPKRWCYHQLTRLPRLHSPFFILSNFVLVATN
jgi:hypothetical protein